MQLIRNIFANYIGTVVVALGPLLALPWYLSELGPKQFGLIGFVTILQAILALLDAGMSQALVREIAIRFNQSGKGRYSTGVLLFGFERIYWLFALFVGFILLLMADVIAQSWINLDGLPTAMGRDAIYGAAVIFAVQFPGSIYRSVLVGIQKQVTLNSILIGFAVLRNFGGVIVILIWPHLSTYLIWQVIVAFFETLLRYKLTWSELRIGRNNFQWDFMELRPILKIVAGMSGAALLATLTVQMDRIVLSHMVSIEQFGYYTISAMVSLGLLQLITPLTQAVLPHAVQLRNNAIELRKLSVKLTGVIVLLIGFGAIFFATAGKWLLNVWLQDSDDAVSTIFSIMSVLLLGTALNALYNVGYMNWLVQHEVYRILQVNIAAFVLSAVLIPIFVSRFGTIGAAFGWLAINLIGFFLSLGWLREK